MATATATKPAPAAPAAPENDVNVNPAAPAAPEGSQAAPDGNIKGALDSGGSQAAPEGSQAAPAPEGSQAAPDQKLRVEIVNPSADPNTIEFVKVNDDLGLMIRTQHASFIAWFAARGRLVRKGLNIRFRKSMTKDARKLARSDSLKAMEATALVNMDRNIEPEPKLDRWIAHSIVLDFEPQAANLKSVNSADSLATLWTRIDPPSAWNAEEEYALKPGLDADAVRSFILRAVSEAWSAADVKAGLDTLWGAAQEPDKVVTQKTDTVKAARSLAESIMDRIREHKVDPETLFDELQSQLTRYGWSLAKGRDAKGVETLKPIRTARPATK